MEDIEFLKRTLQEEIVSRKNAEMQLEKSKLEIEKLRQDFSTAHKEILENYIHKEQVLVSNTSRLSSLILNLDSAILLEDENRKIVLVNQKFCDIFSIPIPPEQLIGSDCSSSAQQTKNLFKDPEQFISRIEDILLNKKKVLSDELQLVDGRILKRDFIPVFNNNDYLGHLWNYEDLTNYIHVKKKIESLSRFPKESPNPILRCTPSGTVIYANAAAKPFVSVLSTAKYNSSYNNSYDLLVANLDASYKTRIHIKNEITIKDKTFNVSYVPVDNEEYVNIYATDITATKESEGKIYLLKELLNQLDEFIQVIDKDGNFIFINESSANRFQRPIEDFETLNIKNIVPSFYNNMTWEEQFDFFKEKKNFTLESTHTKPDNTSYPIEASIKYTSVHEKEYIISFSKDISERKQRDEALKNLKEFYEDILNNIPSDIAVFNNNYQYLYVNPAAIKDEETRKWIIGKTDLDYCRYKGKDDSLAIMRRKNHDILHEHKKPLEWEDVFNKDGEISYVLRKFHPVLDANGNIKIIIGNGINITEIKHVQEKLAKSEELYRLVIHATNDGIWDWDLASGNLYLSERWKSMLGYTDETLANHISSWEKTMHPDDLTIAKQILQDHFEKRKPYDYTLRYVHVDGTIRWIMCRGYAIRNRKGEPYRMLGSCTDVTDQKVAEEKLKENEEKLQAIFNHSHDAKFLVDIHTNKIIEFNQRTIELFEIDKPETLYNFPATSLRKNPLSAAELEKAQTEFSRNGYWNQEVVYLTQKGNEFWGNIVAKKIFINNREVILSRITDITENKRNEQELITAKQLAEESTKAKEMFLANMSHEIRTPMNGILGMTELLSRTTLDEAQKKHVKLIKNSADNLLVVINDILDIAKIDSGKITFEEIPFDICDVIKNAIQTLTYKAEEKGIELLIHPIKLDHRIVIGDPFRLTQALLNLINNAIKFTENGSVEISGRIPHSNATEITFEFTVTDTGIGIPKEKLDSIFEGFTQASLDTTRKYGGTGLGLTISKNLIQLQGGSIWVESVVGKGSKFIFSITYKKGYELNETHESNEKINIHQLNKLHILLAEDNEVNQYFAKTLMDEIGVKVDVANNGIEALNFFEQNEYDLILMDIQMPHMGGIEATSKIRSHSNKDKSRIPIIALTANALVGDADKYMEAGMDDYISKPFDRETLFRKLQHHTKKDIVHDVMNQHTTLSSDTNEVNLPNYAHLEKNFQNNVIFLKKIYTLFIETTPEIVNDLKQFSESNDYEKVQATAHKLKASIDAFKIASLHDTIRNIEKFAATKIHLEEIPGLIKSTDEILKIAQKDIEKKLKEMD
jgi:PAS domain S-box-containing protein